MIILDIETSGLDPRRHCMLSLGAVDYDTGKGFYGECSLYLDSEVDDYALEVNGFKREDTMPGMKQSAHYLYRDFAQWCDVTQPIKENRSYVLAGHNIGSFDLLWIKHLHDTHWTGSPWLFGYKTVDLHTVAYAAFGESLSHSDICRKLGLEPEPKPHNALHGARSERDCLKLLLPMLRGTRKFEHLHDFKI